MGLKLPSLPKPRLPFKKRKATVPEKYKSEFSFPSLIDNVINEGIEFHSDHFIQQIGIGSKKYGRSFYIKPSGYPRKVRIGWLEGLFTGDDINVSVHITPFDRTDAVRKLKNKLDDYETVVISAQKQQNAGKIEAIGQQVRDAKTLREQIQNNMNSLHFASISATVYADTLEELNEKSVAVERALAAESIEVVNAYDRQKEGFLSTQPLGTNYLKKSERNLDENALAAMFPHNSSTLNHTGGMPIGVYNNEYIYYNNFDPKLSNFGMGVFGIAGTGKGVLVKTIIGRGFSDGITKNIILDVEPEYIELTYALGGIVIELKSDGVIGEFSRINPLDVYVEKDVKRRYTPFEYVVEKVNISEKIKEAIEFFKVMKESTYPKDPNLDPHELDALDKILKKLYSKCGITEDPESLYYHEEDMDENGNIIFNRVYKKMPTISDVHREIEALIHDGNKMLDNLLSVVALFLAGRSFGMFDCQTDIRDKDGNSLPPTALDESPIVTFDISKLSKNGIERPLAQHVLMTWVWNRLILNNPKEKKRVIQDEAWMMLKFPSMVEFFKTLSARGRKWNVALTLVSQRYEMFHRNEEARDIIAQLGTVVFMKQSDSDVEKILEAFHFSDDVGQVIRTAEQGDVVMKAGKEIVYFHVVPTDSEWQYINTNMNVTVDELIAKGG